MAGEIISLKDVCFSYGENTVLDNVNLNIYQNDFLGIIGPNGGGKSTLIKIMLGLIRPDSGRIRVFGGEPHEKSCWIGYVPQYRTFDFGFPISVMEVVLMGRLGHIKKTFRKFSDEDRKIASDTLKLLDMEEFGDRQIDQLSGGQQQKVMLARALAGKPRVLLLDEPTNHIDVQTEMKFFEILEKLHSEMPIVVVSHDIGAISTHIDRVGCLNRKLYVHESGKITRQMLADTYHCPIELIAHGVPHRVLQEHEEMDNS